MGSELPNAVSLILDEATCHQQGWWRVNWCSYSREVDSLVVARALELRRTEKTFYLHPDSTDTIVYTNPFREATPRLGPLERRLRDPEGEEEVLHHLRGWLTQTYGDPLLSLGDMLLGRRVRYGEVIEASPLEVGGLYGASTGPRKGTIRYGNRSYWRPSFLEALVSLEKRTQKALFFHEGRGIRLARKAAIFGIEDRPVIPPSWCFWNE